MLCCPARSPINASSLFPGGDLKSRNSVAAFNIVSLRCAAANMFANRATRFPSNNALVSGQAKDRIIIVGSVAVLYKTIIYRLPINDKQDPVVGMMQIKKAAAAAFSIERRMQIRY
jgi:hypothetical protein